MRKARDSTIMSAKRGSVSQDIGKYLKDVSQDIGRNLTNADRLLGEGLASNAFAAPFIYWLTYHITAVACAYAPGSGQPNLLQWHDPTTLDLQSIRGWICFELFLCAMLTTILCPLCAQLIRDDGLKYLKDMHGRYRCSKICNKLFCARFSCKSNYLNLSKSGNGSLLGRSVLQIWIIREKLYV